MRCLDLLNEESVEEFYKACLLWHADAIFLSNKFTSYTDFYRNNMQLILRYVDGMAVEDEVLNRKFALCRMQM